MFDEPIVRDYLAEHRIWHLIGAHDYEGVVNALTSPESLVNAALDRGVRAVEYDLALALAHCSSELGQRSVAPTPPEPNPPVDRPAQAV